MRKLTNVYYRNLEAYANDNYKLIVNQGGTSSSKTYSILQLLKDHALYSEDALVITVVSHSVPHLKIGALRDMKNICDTEEIDWERNFNQSDKILKIGKSIIEFISVDKLKSHGGRRDVLFVNEANGIDWDVFRQLYIRTRYKTIIDYNPVGEFWYHEEIKPNNIQYPHIFIHSTYRDNPFIDGGTKYTLDHAQKGTNFYRVYVDGEAGIAEGVIFPDWSRGEFDESLPFCFGVDFGAVDPDAVVRVAYDPKLKNLYVQEMYYQKGNGTEQLVKDMIELRDKEIKRRLMARRYPWSEINRNVPFICDSAGKKMIIDLTASGVNAIPAYKYPDSVRTEIRELQDINIIVCGESPNLERELNNYIYNDKKSNTPIDSFNHLIDAMRYGWGWLTGGANDGVHNR